MIKILVLWVLLLLLHLGIDRLYSPLSAWDTEILDNSMENMTNQMKVLSSLSRWEEIILNKKYGEHGKPNSNPHPKLFSSLG